MGRALGAERPEVTFRLGLEAQVRIPVEQRGAQGILCRQLAFAIGMSGSLELGRQRVNLRGVGSLAVFVGRWGKTKLPLEAPAAGFGMVSVGGFPWEPLGDLHGGASAVLWE